MRKSYMGISLPDPSQCDTENAGQWALLPSREWAQHRHGRDAGYPAPPVQTRTCSFPASGSSVALASAQAVSVSGHTLFAIARREVGSYESGPTCPG